MAFTVTTVTMLEQTIFGNKRINVLKFSCGAYDTDGIACTAAICGLANLDYVLAFFVGDGLLTGGPVTVVWDKDSTAGPALRLVASSGAAPGSINMGADSQYIYVIAIGT